MTGSAPPPHVLIIGEALVDRVEQNDGATQEHPGGSPANVAVTLGRLGHRPHLLTSYGRDAAGAAVETWLRQSNVHLVAGSDSAPATSVASSQLAPDGSASYSFDIRWDPRPTTQLEAPSLVHIGSIGALLAPGANTVHTLVQSMRTSATITYDPNLRPALCPDRDQVRAQVEKLVSVADVVKASDEDLAWLYPHEDALEVLHRWATVGTPRAVVGTFGAGGTIAVFDGRQLHVPAPTAAVADTIGAGDSFMGALIHGLVQCNLTGARNRERLTQIGADVMHGILQTCVDVAAITVSRPGANPPWADELIHATK
ncbi:carbohydrate kinase [Georgenia daeguensis]|uniref:Carbohydrate kinase n=1 Tax=Georgenia daeguensis TaxID=908355 RepID=A0ABP8EY52_9MICO